MPMRREATALVVFIGVTVLVVGAIACLNTVIDPSGVSSGTTVRRLASRQSSAALIVSPVAFDQRMWLKGRLEALASERRCPDLLVVGSSTIGMISRELALDPGLLNGFVAGPTVEDLEAISVLLERSHCRPARIVIGIDPWFANARMADERWRSLMSEVRIYHGATALEELVDEIQLGWQLVKERLNFATTRQSLAGLLREGKGPLWRRPRLSSAPLKEICRELGADPYLRAQDGHFLQCPQSELAARAVRHVAATYVDRDFHGMRSWKEVDVSRLARLEAVLESLKGRTRSLVVFAPPYHPVTYERLVGTPSIRTNLEQFDAALTVIGRRLGIRYVNLRDPARPGCQEEEFADSHHARPACARRWAAFLADDQTGP